VAGLVVGCFDCRRAVLVPLHRVGGYAIRAGRDARPVTSDHHPSPWTSPCSMAPRWIFVWPQQVLTKESLYRPNLRAKSSTPDLLVTRERLEMICLIRLTRLRLAAVVRTAAVAPTAPPSGCRTRKTSAWGNRMPDGTHSTTRKPAAPQTRSTGRPPSRSNRRCEPHRRRCRRTESRRRCSPPGPRRGL